jgi:hypothetical protein
MRLKFLLTGWVEEFAIRERYAAMVTGDDRDFPA